MTDNKEVGAHRMNNSSVSKFRGMQLAALTIGLVLMGIGHAAHAQSFSDGAGMDGKAFPNTAPFIGNTPLRNNGARPPARAPQRPAAQAPNGQRTGLPDTENGEGQQPTYGDREGVYDGQSAAPHTLRSGQASPQINTRADENGVGDMDQARTITSGNERAALCGKPGVSCDDHGNTTYTYDDGSTMTETPEGTRSSTNADGSPGSRADGTPAGGGKQASCEDEAATARKACMFPGTSGMDESSSMMYTMMMNQLVTTATQIAAIGKNMSAQCKLQGDVAKVMGTINGVKGATCMKMINSCGTTCTDEANAHRQKATDYGSRNQYGQFTGLISDEKKSAGKKSRLVSECKAYSMQVVAMMNGAMQNLGNFAQAKQCQNELAAFAAPPPLATLPPVAAIGDCSDPANQSLACFCTRPANAASAMCAGFAGGGGGGGGTTTTPNGSTIASPVGGSVADATDGNTADPFAIPKKEGGGDGKGMGDGGSGAPGGSGLSALGSEGGGSGGPGDSRSAITGTSGGNGSGLGSAGGGGGGGGLSRNNGGGAKDGFFDKFNLRKFLPGSKYKTRGIAGMSVKSVDGITGPMGPSLFEKATRQYQEQIQKQNVILDK